MVKISLKKLINLLVWQRSVWYNMGREFMTKSDYREYLINKQKDISEEGKHVRNPMTAITYRCLINLLEEILEKFDIIEE